jgi:hypothetical protein
LRDKEALIVKRGLIRFTLTAALVVLLAAFNGSIHAGNYQGSGSYDYLYYIEGTGAYVLPDPATDIFFNLGKWYRRSDDTWSVGTTSDGPWREIFIESVPAALADLPPDFRTTHRLGRIPYRYVTGSGSGRYDDGSRYFRGWRGPRYHYYRCDPCRGWDRDCCDYNQKAYRRHWRRLGTFLFFTAPHIIDD